MKILYRNVKLSFIIVVHIGLPNPTLRSYSKERPVPKIMIYMRMTENLSSPIAFYKPKGGGEEDSHGASCFHWNKRILKQEKMSSKNNVCLKFFPHILIYKKMKNVNILQLRNGIS